MGTTPNLDNISAALGDDLDELGAAQQVVFKLLMAASNAANTAWNAEDDAASQAADVDYDAARRVLAAIDRRIAHLVSLDAAAIAWIIETDDLDELRGRHDALSDKIAKVDWHIRELEDRDAREAERELRLDYFASR